ncbi:alpha/beta fold hydrolase [Gorillibacterium sp. sgz500922]|uniref:alpha/beta fold hydrolase n=1 Tax=Gorillibacterium sp. sgz500922 TaxID=3446694 RepID=UPI003F6765F8
MKKFLAGTTAILLLLTGVPGYAAAGEVKVSYDDTAIAFSDAQPYPSGHDLMVPIRAAAQALHLQTTYAEGQVRLTAPSLAVSFKIGSGTATMNGQAKPFGAASLSKQNRVYVPLTFFKEVLGLDTAYDTARKEAAIRSVNSAEQTAAHIAELLAAGRYQQISDDYLAAGIQGAAAVAQLQSAWEQIVAVSGKYTGIGSVESAKANDGTTQMNALLHFTQADVAFLAVLNSSGKVIALQLKPVQAAVPVPDNLAEEEVTVGAGTPYALKGTLTLPKNHTGALPAVILVQGSGPSDRDETVGAYKPFRDIAWGLAQQGVAVLRYDKRTYVYGSRYTPEQLMAFTVKEETVEDAVAASKLLKSDKRIDPTRVYLAGHSLGGMLAPRIDADGGNFAGLILLAGSARPLWEIMYDQNVAVLQKMSDQDPAKEAGEKLLTAELSKAQNLKNLTDEEAKATTLFGVPAYYFKEMDRHSAADLVVQLSKPLLIMQGEDDFQSDPDKDYGLWQELLKGKSNAVFKLYPGLNHFFVDYQGKDEGTVDEYTHPGVVEPQVIQDMANWILSR